MSNQVQGQISGISQNNPKFPNRIGYIFKGEKTWYNESTIDGKPEFGKGDTVIFVVDSNNDIQQKQLVSKAPADYGQKKPWQGGGGGFKKDNLEIKKGALTHDAINLICNGKASSASEAVALTMEVAKLISDAVEAQKPTTIEPAPLTPTTPVAQTSATLIPNFDNLG